MPTTAMHDTPERKAGSQRGTHYFWSQKLEGDSPLGSSPKDTSFVSWSVLCGLYVTGLL